MPISIDRTTVYTQQITESAVLMADENKQSIWTWSASQISQSVASRSVKAQEVVNSYIQRIEEVNPKINAIVVRLFDEAIKMAKQIDENKQRTNSPLLGVPMSIKECFFVKGCKATVGLDQQNIIQKSDGKPVKFLREAGAIPLGLSNIPQLMIIHDTKNPVYGKTCNPWSLSHSVGGSSGGEAAAVAAGCSAVGLGGDLGGSIRLPAHFCGVHGIKPTNKRLTQQGTFENLRGMRSVEFQPGPIARHVEDLDRFFHAFFPQNSDWQSGEVAVGDWKDFKQVDLSQLKVGFFIDESFLPPCPAIRRVITESVQYLQDAGVTVTELRAPNILEAMKHDFALMSADGGADFRRLLAGSTREPEIDRLVKLARTPRWIRPLLAAYLRWQGEEILAELFLASGPRSADSHWQTDFAAEQFKKEIFAQWDQEQVDVVLCPPHSLPAFEHDRSVDLLPTAGYAFLFNLLGVPCGTLASSRVQPTELTEREFTKDPVIKAAIHCEKQSEGMPVSVQVAARPWREDNLIAVMHYLEKKFRESETYPDITKLSI